MRVHWLFVWVLWASAGLSSAAAAVTLAPQEVDSKTYSETFTAIAVLQDGTYVQAQLAMTNIGIGSGQTGCQLVVANPNAQAKVNQSTGKRDDWEHRMAPNPSLRVGPCRMTVTATGLQFDGEVDGLAVLLALHAVPVAKVPPEHPVRVGDDFYESEILVSFADADVTLAQGSKLAVTRSGFGYADHSRSTLLPAKLGRGWLRFRGFGPGCHTVFLARFLPGKKDEAKPRISAYRMRSGDASPQALKGIDMVLPKGEQDQVSVVATWPGFKGTLNITGRRRILRQAPLEEHGFLGRVVGSLVGTVVTEVYDAVLDDHGHCRQVRGILEVDHIND